MNKVIIGKEIRMLSNIISRHIENLTNFQEANRTTGTNTWIIAYLYKKQDIDVFQKDIEREFSVTRSTASKVIKLMEQKELIVRKPVDYDGRLKKITLTQKALDLHQSIVIDLENLEKMLTRNLSNQEKETLLLLIDKMKQNMKDTTTR